MAQSFLFSKDTFLHKAATVSSQTRKDVDGLTLASFADQEPEAIAAQLYAASRVEAFAINFQGITQSTPQEVNVQVAMEAATNGQTMGYVTGDRFRFSIPFTGNGELLQLRPTGATGDAPFGEVGETEIVFTLEQPATANVEDLLSAYLANKNAIAGYATKLGQEVEAFNASLQQQITQMVNARKTRLDKQYADAQAFGVPIV